MLRSALLTVVVLSTALPVCAVRPACVAKIIVNRAALYEEGHFGEEDYIIEWLEYRDRISEVEPVGYRGENSPGIARVTLADGRKGLMDRCTFGSFATISADYAFVYDEPFGKRRFMLKRGDRLGNPYSLSRYYIFDFEEILTEDGITGWVKCGALTHIALSGERKKTLSEEGPSTSTQGARR